MAHFTVSNLLDRAHSLYDDIAYDALAAAGIDLERINKAAQTSFAAYSSDLFFRKLMTLQVKHLTKQSLNLYFNAGGTVTESFLCSLVPNDVNEWVNFLGIILLLKEIRSELMETDRFDLWFKLPHLNPKKAIPQKIDFDLLFKKLASADQPYAPLFHAACKTINYGLVEALCNAGYPVDIPETTHGCSSLYLSTDRELAQFLINKGANVNHKSKTNKWVPLHHAASKKLKEVARVLLKNKALVDAKNINDTTPLMTAAKSNALEVMRMLKRKGADLNATANDGATPLHYTVPEGTETAPYLIRKGADPVIKDKNGDTFFSLFIKHGPCKFLSTHLQEHPNILNNLKEKDPDNNLKVVKDPSNWNLSATKFSPLQGAYYLQDLALDKEFVLKIYSPARSAILEFGNLKSQPPKGLTKADWEKRSLDIDLNDLLEMFKAIDFSDWDPTKLTDDTGRSYTLEELEKNLGQYIQKVTSYPHLVEKAKRILYYLDDYYSEAQVVHIVRLALLGNRVGETITICDEIERENKDLRDHVFEIAEGVWKQIARNKIGLDSAEFQQVTSKIQEVVKFMQIIDEDIGISDAAKKLKYANVNTNIELDFTPDEVKKAFWEQYNAYTLQEAFYKGCKNIPDNLFQDWYKEMGLEVNIVRDTNSFRKSATRYMLYNMGLITSTTKPSCF